MFNNILNKSYKTEDGELWLSRSVAVIGIIVVIDPTLNFKVLTLKRSKTMTDKPNRWCLPCGYLDWNETLEQAVEREVYEETGFLMRDHEKFLVSNIPYFRIDSNFQKANRQNISISFVKVYKLEKLPELVLNEEVSELLWCSLDDKPLKELNLTFGHYDLVDDARREMFNHWRK